MLLPQAAMSATPRPVQISAMSDVVLGVRGTLVGRVVDGRGRALSGRTVRVHRGAKLIAWVQTDRTGRFTVQNLPGGPYAVTCGSATQLVRAWAAGSAPPRTAAAIVLVDQPLVVRGQGGEADAEADGFLGMSEFGLVAVGAAVVAILIAESGSGDSPPASP
jgi:hypothetical protein